MEDREGKLLFRIQVALLLLSCATAAAAQDGMAAGSFTIDGAATPLTHAYASAQPGILDKAAEDIRVLLSSVPLRPEMRRDTFALVKLARDGKAVIVEIVLDAKGEPLTGALYTREFNGMASTSGMHLFTRHRLEWDRIGGRLWMDAPRSFMKVTYHYDATFSAAIPRPPTAEQLAAALASPPARVAGDYWAALRAGQLPAFVALLSPALAAEYSGAAGEARYRQLRADMPADAKVTGVTRSEDGDTLVTIEGRQGGVAIEYTLKMVLEGGQWRVGK